MHNVIKHIWRISTSEMRLTYANEMAISVIILQCGRAFIKYNICNNTKEQVALKMDIFRLVRAAVQTELG